MSNQPTTVPVAVIGIGCIFPKSPGLKEYWRLIFNAENAISEVPPTHWSADEYFDIDPTTPDHTYCKNGGFLPAVSFDPTEFGIPPNALEATDSSQLLSLLVAKAALMDAGYGEDKKFDRDRTSVILGVTGTQELVIPLGARLGFPRWKKALDAAGVESETTENVIQRISDSYVAWQEGSFPGLLGNVVAGRICNRLDLRGTNCVVDAACASSLSAVHLALLEITSGRSDMVVTGGVDTLNDIFMHMCFAKTRILSPTGDARPFSIDADGTVLGEGIGLVVLKRLADAEKDGDRIYAVIRGIGSSSDGKSQSIYAPRADGQVVALRKAYDQAGVDPGTVDLIETHGTGTKVGDAVEFNALRQVFENGTDRNRKCAIGSVKSMIGHTKAAAGAAGLIKGVLALHHKVLPPTLKATQPDPKLEIAKSPFYINTHSSPWIADPAHPRRCGVSAFGFGGSNFHIVLEEHRPEKTEMTWDGSIEILALSASSKTELIRKIEAVRADIEKGAALSVAAVRSRRSFNEKDHHRLMWVHDRSADHSLHSPPVEADILAAELRQLQEGIETSATPRQGIYTGEGPPIGQLAFLFPGQGSQYPGMGRDLMCRFPEAFGALEAACRQFDDTERLYDAIYPHPATTPEELRHQTDVLRRTDITQPAIGAMSLALFKVLIAFGVVPHATAGHSFGELMALHAAGRIDEPTFLSLATTRGRLMAAANDSAPRSGMLAVKAPLEHLRELIDSHGSDVVLANCNTPNQGVLAGTYDALSTIETICRQKGYSSVMLPVAAAFHSQLVKVAQAPFKKALETITMSPGTIPVYSNSTGAPYPGGRAAATALLGDHLLKTVNFVQEIKNLFDSGIRTFIEVGPRNVLSGLVDEILAGENFQTLAMDATAGKRSSLSDIAHTICQLAAAGHRVDWRRWEPHHRQHRIPQMQIPLTGANYRNPSDLSPRPSNIPVKRAHEHNHPNRTIRNDMPGGGPSTRPERPPLQPEHPDGNPDLMKNMTPDIDLIKQALLTVQQSLASMQTLQRQTAETHQKFLDTQKEAGRTLQHMLEHSHRLTELSMGERPAVSAIGAQSAHTTIRETNAISYRTEPVVTPGVAAIDPRPTASVSSSKTTIPQGQVEDSHVSAHPPAASKPSPEPENRSDSNTVENLQQVLLAVVSELTGYPVDMIDPDMDIESDLGIDSIKRVEILSTLEERVPGMPAVAPDVIGKLKTLRQVADLLNVSEPVDTPLDSEPAPTSDSDLKADSVIPNFLPQNELLTVLLEVVSELTGYPNDMIGAEMDIEADLGIDSIKRVEILSAMEEKIPGLPTVAPDQLGKLKTLQQIVNHLTNKTPVETPAIDNQTPAKSTAIENQPDPPRSVPKPQPSPNLSRQVVTVVDKRPGQRTPVLIPSGRKVYITEDSHGLSTAIADTLGQLEINTVLISPNILKYKENLPPAGGLIVVLSPDNPLPVEELKEIFRLTTRLAPELKKSAAQGGALFATVSRLDGAFGFHGKGVSHPLQGALSGLVKTAAIEWNSVHCRAFDVAPGWQDHGAIAEKLVEELLGRDPSDPVELGLDTNRRYVLELEASPIAELKPMDSILAPGDVVIVTGGARGVTAASSIALANASGSRLNLLGRSPAPVPEPLWLKDLDDETAIKRAILDNDVSGGGSPTQLEAAYRKYMANREIANNLAAIKNAGASVRYVSVDIRDTDAVQQAISDIISTQGPVTAVVHGAGILEDRLIEDKTPDQFQRVFETKVRGLENILAASGTKDLRHLILFSSVSGRMGNRGQADYAMANEALNKIAQQFSAHNPNCRVVAINWGPWDGGMVTASLKREFHRRGVALIPTDLGARHLVAEMCVTSQPQVEVIVGGTGFSVVKEVPNAESIEVDVEKITGNNLSLTFQRDIDLGTHPVLRSHMIGGKPVVPLALMTEWFGHGALHENPGLQLQGLDDIRVLKGIIIEGIKKHVRVLAGKARKTGSGFEVPVELRDGVQDNVEVVHSRARAILVDTLKPAPDYRIPDTLTQRPYTRTIQQVYEQILFHGPDLHGIREITHLSSYGMIAQLDPAPAPSDWLKEPLRNNWIADPLALDAAFQMATVWCYEEKGTASLPSYCANYRQYRPRFPADGLTAVLEVDSVSSFKMKGTITFLDGEGIVVARISGCEAVMDQTLHNSFKPAAA